MRACRINRDDGTLDRQRSQQRRYRRQFVGFLARGLLSQHDADTRGQGADPVQCLALAAPAAPAGLAVHGHYRARFQRGDHARHPLPKALLHSPRIQHPEYPPHGVVRGDAMLKFHELP